MKHSQTYKNIHARVLLEKDPEKKNISYSQYSVYKQCPHRWWLHYGLAMYPFTSSMNTVFGTAIHETLQHWITLMFEESVKASDELPLIQYFEDRLIFNYKKEVESNNGVHFSSPTELDEFYNDGVAILKYMKAKRGILFDTKAWELIGIEIPLYTTILDDTDKFEFQGFMDVVFYEESTKTIYIPDFKTSTRGWKKEKTDQLKQDQALLYKHYFAKQMGWDIDNIETKFIILKRKIWEEADYPQPRVQTHIPAQAKAKVNQAVKGLEAFVKDCFNPDGTVVKKYHPKEPGYACRFCPFNTNSELCDQKKLC